MSVAEMKKIIREKVEKLNEDQLKEVTSFIKMHNAPVSEWNLTDHVNSIMNERQKVLQKLAK